ncbi:MAG: transposase [Planctomycetaceae bacterium]
MAEDPRSAAPESAGPAGTDPTPGAGSIDGQRIKATEIAACRGYDGGKKITGRKRHIIVDTLGLLLVVVVTVASADDGTSAPEVLARLSAEHRSWLELLWADSKSHNHRLEGWLVESAAGSRIEVVRRPPGSEGDVKLPRRWVVERTFAWLGRSRRNSRDDERSTGSSEAMIKVSSIHHMIMLLKHDEEAGAAQRPGITGKRYWIGSQLIQARGARRGGADGRCPQPSRPV